MSRPRCGFPDVADFVLLGSKWNKTALTYAFREFTPDLTQSEARDAIREAFQLWANVTPLTFSQVAPSASADIEIRFADGNHGDGCHETFDGRANCSRTHLPAPGGWDVAGDCYFDDAETWTENLQHSGIDLIREAAHEFGHSLGLDHSPVTTALMFAFYDGAQRNLDADDIAGIRELYIFLSSLSATSRLVGFPDDGVGVVALSVAPRQGENVGIALSSSRPQSVRVPATATYLRAKLLRSSSSSLVGCSDLRLSRRLNKEVEYTRSCATHYPRLRRAALVKRGRRIDSGGDAPPSELLIPRLMISCSGAS